MPLNEALFWFGLTAFGTGLFFFFEAGMKRAFAVALSVIGLLACVYSIYHHDHPETPTIRIWVILLIITWSFLGYVVYLLRSKKAAIAQAGSKQWDEEKRDYADRCLNLRGELARYTEILNPRQIEAFSIAKELRDFLEEMGPLPAQPPSNPGEGVDGFLIRLHVEGHTEQQAKWRSKLAHGYANRNFGPRITALMHRVGEEFEYPAWVPNFAEKTPWSEDDVRRLAQQMETVAIFINRKVRGEVNLLK